MQVRTRVETGAGGKCHLEKGREDISGKKVDSFRFIHDHKNGCPVAVLCRKLGVTRAGYYAWIKRKQSQRAMENKGLLEVIKQVHSQSQERYGYPRVHAELKRQGIECGRHRVARLMRDNGLLGRKARRFKNHRHKHHIYDNSQNLLLDRPSVTATNQVWVGDITFVRVGRDWSYLSVVMDLYSRKVLGWTIQKHRSAELVSESLIMAADSNPSTPATIFHSDQGSEYASKHYMRVLKERNLRMSMSRKGHCWDNAHMESFFHTLKTEMIYFQHFKTLEEATAYTMDYIHFYNHERIHSGLGYLTPVECEQLAA